MGTHSEMGARLERIMTLLETTVMNRMDAITGLFAPVTSFPQHAWIRDNVYAVHAMWAMHLAYCKRADADEDVCRANELAMACVKCMQSLMDCMMVHTEKVERFKHTQSPADSLHAKYSTATKSAVVGDNEWGHLQIDAISVYLLTLAQITASGLQIVRNFDEVAFIQNLVWYIENAYRIPDYGMWERGDKTNQGARELNSSSIGMAKAAMQALNDVGDLFGDGSRGSIIHVLPDEVQQCAAVLASMLPRESFSKETDSSLLTIIGYPAFAVEEIDLVAVTRDTIKQQLSGNYGCRRFIRDGYRTAIEDPNRSYYNNAELAQFENIECEWPLFACYNLLDALFSKNADDVAHYWALLERVVLRLGAARHGHVPELYMVPRDCIDAERRERGSQRRVPAGECPHLWSQSLYVLCQLLMEGLLSPAELDPLSRRLCFTDKPPPTEVQVVCLAESRSVRDKLARHDVRVQSVSELDPVFLLQPASVLARILNRVGRSDKMHLTGRPLDRDVGLLSTSKLYQLGDKFIVFTPQFMERQRSYTYWDIRVQMDEWRSELQYIHAVWNNSAISGRPLVVLIIGEHMMKETADPTHRTQSNCNVTVATLKKLKTGYLGGARVVMRKIVDFFRTTTVSKLELHSANTQDTLVDLSAVITDGDTADQSTQSLRATDKKSPHGRTTTSHHDTLVNRMQKQKRMAVIRKTSMRQRSIMLDANDEDLVKLRLNYYKTGPKDDQKQQHSRSPQSTGYTNPIDERAEETLTADGEEHEGRRGSEIVGTSAVNDFNESYSELNVEPPTPTLGGVNIAANPTIRMHGSTTLPILRTVASSLHDSHSTPPSSKLNLRDIDEMNGTEIIELLNEADSIEDQGAVVHYLWMNKGADWDTNLAVDHSVSVRSLMRELYAKACMAQSWALVRLAAGLLRRHHEDLAKAVTHLLVRQKQVTIGLPTQREVPITVPESPLVLKTLFEQVYEHDGNTCMLAEEIIVHLGTLVRTEPKLFVEMLRLRIGLIIQVLASELARTRQIKADEASEALLSVTPYQLKLMLCALLSGRLLEDPLHLEDGDDTATRKEQRTGLSVMRRKIEQRKELTSMPSVDLQKSSENVESRHSLHESSMRGENAMESESVTDSEDEEDEDKAFVFGIWMRHRRIDGALNRVPLNFYADVWDILSQFPRGIRVAGNTLHKGLTQEMTRREIKFALQVESILNLIPEPEYRELIVEVLSLIAHLRPLMRTEPVFPSSNEPFDVDMIIYEANRLFVEQNREMDTIVTECCAFDPKKRDAHTPCDGARGVCRHFYDSAPAGEYGTAHYFIRAMMEIFVPRTEEWG